MFYSHEILTQRKYGVATIWLVATLGLSRTALRKVGRKDILSVNLPKACDTVSNPEAPLALRLQSSLLVGISRVYSQQFDYLYHDVSNAHTTLRKLSTEKPAHLDLRGGPIRPDQLVLMDDPLLQVDLLGDVDLSEIGLGLENFRILDLESNAESLLGTPLRASPIFSSPGLGSSAGAVGFSPAMLAEASSSIQGGFRTSMRDDNLQLEENPLWEFDEDGQMRDMTPELPVLRQEESPAMAPGSRMNEPRLGSQVNSEDIEAQVRQEHEEADPIMEGQGDKGTFPDLVGQMDLDLDLDLGNIEAFPEADVPMDTPVQGYQMDVGEEISAVAARKRRPRVKHIRIDDVTFFTIDDLKVMATDYLKNMEDARKEKEARRANRIARGNAEVWVLRHGMGGELINPKLGEMFSGLALMNRFAGQGPDEEGAAKRKHDRQASDGEGEDGRRLRAKTHDELQVEELGRNFGGDRFFTPQLEPLTGNDEVELGRDLPLGFPSDDVQSVHSDMPWVGSGDRIFSGGVIPSSSVRSAFGSVHGRPSESPILPRGIRAGSRLSVAGSVMLEIVEEVDENNLGSERNQSADQFEFFGAGTEVSTQDANTQWLNATMERESFEFLEFIKRKLSEEQERREMELEEEIDFVIFQELIKPGFHRHIVAAQAFSHTLLQASKGLLTVSQEEPFGAIQISVV